jgi:hypothetical protein
VAPSSLVSVVVDPQFGFRLAEQVRLGAVWIIDTPANRAAFEQYWAEHAGGSHLEGVTSFTGLSDASPETLLLNEIDVIDLHHGPLSAQVPYSVLEVLGTALTRRIEEALKGYGFVTFEPIVDGFRASRSLSKVNRGKDKADSLRE